MTTPRRRLDRWQVECTSPVHCDYGRGSWAILDAFDGREEAERYARDLAARCAVPWARFGVSCRVRLRSDDLPVLTLPHEESCNRGCNTFGDGVQ